MEDTAEVERQLLQLGRQFSAMIGRSRRRAGVLDQSAYTILSCLEIRGRMNFAELQLALGLDLSTLNRQMRVLVAAGYAQRETVREGEGGRRFVMTPEGALVWRDERQMTLLALERLMAGWTGCDRKTFSALLGRFNAALESATGLAWPKPDERAGPDHPT